MPGKNMKRQEKIDAIVYAVYRFNFWGKPATVTAIARELKYQPNGTFRNDVWSAVDAGYLIATPKEYHGFNGIRWCFDFTKKAKDIIDRQIELETARWNNG